jgi:hypothetical protein
METVNPNNRINLELPVIAEENIRPAVYPKDEKDGDGWRHPRFKIQIAG